MLSLFGYQKAYNFSDITGVVVDSGEGATHMIPVAHGYVLS